MHSLLMINFMLDASHWPAWGPLFLAGVLSSALSCPDDGEHLFTTQHFLLEQCLRKAIQRLSVLLEHFASLLIRLLEDSLHPAVYALCGCLALILLEGVGHYTPRQTCRLFEVILSPTECGSPSRSDCLAVSCRRLGSCCSCPYRRSLSSPHVDQLPKGPW